MNKQLLADLAAYLTSLTDTAKKVAFINEVKAKVRFAMSPWTVCSGFRPITS